LNNKLQQTSTNFNKNTFQFHFRQSPYFHMLTLALIKLPLNLPNLLAACC